MVRVTAYVLAFITKCRLRADKKLNRNFIWTGPLLSESTIWFSSFPTSYSATDQINPWVNINSSKPDVLDTCLLQSLSADLKPVSLAFFLETYAARDSDRLPTHPSSHYLNMALRYYFRVASNEVVQFNSKNMVEKRTVKQDGILLSKGRIHIARNEFLRKC